MLGRHIGRVLLPVALFGLPLHAVAVDISGCGQTIAPGDVGTLISDVSCGGAFVGVELGDGATLMLNGHEIRDAGGDGGVGCRARCTVTGPGEITSSQTPGVFLGERGRLTISNVQIDHCDSGITGAQSSKRTSVVGSGMNLIDNAQYGLLAGKVTLSSVNAIGNLIGVLAQRKLQATVLVASGNSQVGVSAFTLKASGLTAQDNGDAGVQAARAWLTSSVVTNNHGDSGSIIPGHVIDLRARRARLVDSTCHYSQVLGGSTGDNLGVCTND